MQRTKHGPTGASRLISVLGRRVTMEVGQRNVVTLCAAAILLVAPSSAPGDKWTDVDADVLALRMCKPHDTLGVPTAWSTAGDESFTWSIPGGCRPDPDARFIHGGERWLCDKSDVSLSWGHWGLNSFEHMRPRCRTRINGIRAVVLDEPAPSEDVVVWYLLSSGVYDVVLGVSHGTNAKPALNAAAFSGRVPQTRGKD